MDRTAGGGARSRRNSLDPSRLSRETARDTSLQVPGERHTETRNSSRDASPLGRALSVLSNGSGERDGHHSSTSHHGHHHHFHFHRRPKIPKPTPEQVAYIKKVLVDVPGPSATQGLPPGLRVARPPGSVAPPPAIPTPTGTPTHSQDSISSTTSSLSKLRIAAPVVDWQNTDLFECFRQFTSVEVLEGENSFACRNCWKWLNPDLEAKRREERIQKKRAREERRKARRAAKKGHAIADGHAAGRNGHAEGEEGDSDDERDPADVTARNTPAHSPKAVPAFAPLEEIPPIQPIEAATPAPPAPPSNGTSVPPLSPTTATAKSGVPMRSFSISSAATSNAVSTDYEGGVSSEAFETTTDEEDNTSPGLDDGESLSGSLGVLPSADAKKLPLTVENVEAAAAASSAPATGSLVVPQDGPRDGLAASPAASSAASLAPPPPAAGSGASPSTSVQPLPGHSRPTKPPPKKQRQILRRAHKRYLISPTDLPPVLVIHLKRFMQTSKSSLFGSAFVNLKKRDDPVSFPREMDLTPFLAPAGKPPHVSPNAFGSAKTEEERRSRKSSRNGGVDRPGSSGTEVSEAIEVEKEVHNARYRLYAVVVHHGTIDTGAFSAYPSCFAGLR